MFLCDHFFFLLLLISIQLYDYTIICSSIPSVDSYLDAFQFLAVINKAIMNIYIQISMWTYAFFFLVNTQDWNDGVIW